jgi:hypothetical protein
VYVGSFVAVEATVFVLRSHESTISDEAGVDEADRFIGIVAVNANFRLNVRVLMCSLIWNFIRTNGRTPTLIDLVCAV